MSNSVQQNWKAGLGKYLGLIYPRDIYVVVWKQPHHQPSSLRAQGF